MKKSGLNISEAIRHTKAGTLKAVLDKSKEPGVNIHDLRDFIYSELDKLGFDVFENELQSVE